MRYQYYAMLYHMPVLTAFIFELVLINIITKKYIIPISITKYILETNICTYYDVYIINTKFLISIFIMLVECIYIYNITSCYQMLTNHLNYQICMIILYFNTLCLHWYLFNISEELLIIVIMILFIICCIITVFYVRIDKVMFEYVGDTYIIAYRDSINNYTLNEVLNYIKTYTNTIISQLLFIIIA